MTPNPTSSDSQESTKPALDSKRRGRLVVGLLGLLLGIGYTAYTVTSLPFGSTDEPGAAVFPLVVGVGTIVVSLLTMAEAYFTHAVTGQVNFPVGQRRRTVLGLLLALVGFVLVYPLLGQYVASILFMILALRLLGSRSLVRTVVYGALIGLGVSYFFVDLLGVRLPSGILGP